VSNLIRTNKTVVVASVFHVPGWSSVRDLDVISDLKLNDWGEYLHVTDEMTKNVLCQEKSTFRKPIAVNDSGLEK